MDLVEARRLLRLAAEQGNSAAQYNLGIMNHAGEGGPVDSVEARRLFQLATGQGHAAAQFSLGMMNLKRRGRPSGPDRIPAANPSLSQEWA